jgi:hypothetical protein
VPEQGVPAFTVVERLDVLEDRDRCSGASRPACPAGHEPGAPGGKRGSAAERIVRGISSARSENGQHRSATRGRSGSPPRRRGLPAISDHVWLCPTGARPRHVGGTSPHVKLRVEIGAGSRYSNTGHRRPDLESRPRARGPGPLRTARGTAFGPHYAALWCIAERRSESKYVRRPDLTWCRERESNPYALTSTAP